MHIPLPLESSWLAHVAAVQVQEVSSAAEPETIGVAKMLSDGTIVMHLRTSGSRIGEAWETYTPGNKYYKSVLDHLGKMHPGDTKMVTPFPDD